MEKTKLSLGTTLSQISGTTTVASESLGTEGGPQDLADKLMDEKTEDVMKQRNFFHGRNKTGLSNLMDEYSTPVEAIEAIFNIMKQIHPNYKEMKFWDGSCGSKKNIINFLVEQGCKTHATDFYAIPDDHVDFLTTTIPPDIDFIWQNPPFSLDTEFLKRCFELGKPFLLLMLLDKLGNQGKYELLLKYGAIIFLIFPKPKFINEETSEPTHVGNVVWIYWNPDYNWPGDINLRNCGSVFDEIPLPSPRKYTSNGITIMKQSKYH